MNNSRNHEPSFGISLGDIYFVIFRHKWKILTLTLIGLLAGAGYFFTNQPPYQSDAKLLIRYVSDTRDVTPEERTSKVTSVTDPAQSVINSEMEILHTFDLCAMAATNLGPEKILAKIGGGSDAIAAAFAIQSNLKVEPSLGSSVIRISFRHPDPSLVQPVLREIIRDYKEIHFKVHSDMGFSDAVMAEQITALRLQLAQIDDELRMAKTNAGIVDVDEAKKSYSGEISRIRRELFQAESELAGHEAEFQTKSVGTNSAAPLNVPVAQVSKYKAVASRVSFLQKKEDEYLFRLGYTEENKLVKEVRAGLAEATKIKTDMEEKYPPLADMVFGMSDAAPVTAPIAPLINSSPQRVRTLELQLARIQSDAAKLGEAEAKIDDLQRKKTLLENNYKYFVNSQDEANIKENLGSSRAPNIGDIQQPSPPFKEYGKFYKNIFLLAIGGLLVGFAWAFLIEFYFDRSVKRPVEIETKLRIPFFLSIPDLGLKNGGHRLTGPERRQLTAGEGEKTASGNGSLTTTATLEMNSLTVNHALDAHYDALRDRLVLYFESINLTRKPKLVAVTSTDRGAGVSTIASGLAASLSETGDGRVLLVDMNQENGAAQQFFNGKPNCKLDDALIREKREEALVQDRLYVVSEGSQGDKISRVLPKRFATLVPQLKASDYDYIIFDMPPVSQTSVTTRLAGFMDTVMLVIESEKTDRESVQQAHTLLAQSKANVTAVLNKTKQYVPARLRNDINHRA